MDGVLNDDKSKTPSDEKAICGMELEIDLIFLYSLSIYSIELDASKSRHLNNKLKICLP